MMHAIENRRPSQDVEFEKLRYESLRFIGDAPINMIRTVYAEMSVQTKFTNLRSLKLSSVL